MSDIQVKKRSDKAAKVFLIIPLVIFVLSVLCFTGGCILEVPTSRGVIYTLLVLGSFILFGLNIVPGAVFSIIGLVRAVRAKMTGFIVLGIIETAGAALSVLAVFIIVFVTGPSV